MKIITHIKLAATFIVFTVIEFFLMITNLFVLGSGNTTINPYLFSAGVSLAMLSIASMELEFIANIIDNGMTNDAQ
jgi:hypothetical protein